MKNPLAPYLVSQWHPTKNGTLRPEDVSAGSNKLVWWLAPCGHEWDSSPKNRKKSSGSGCPVCAGVLIVYGVNDLETVYPDVFRQISLTLNPMPLNLIYKFSSTKYWWECPKNSLHTWETTVLHRTRHGQNCPFCSGNKILKDDTDIATTHPWVVESLHPTKNTAEILEGNFSFGSHKKAWFKCAIDEKHSWYCTVKDFSSGKSTCPHCSATRFSSKGEHELIGILSKLDIQAQSAVRGILKKNLELDIYIPEHSFAIEFNGVYWHSEAQKKNKYYHQEKYNAAKEVDLQLVQIWEDDWKNRKFAILRALAHKLGSTDKLAKLYPELHHETTRIFARNTQIVRLTSKEAKVFLEANHIQGFAAGSYYLGLQTDQGTCAVLVLKKEPGTDGKTLNIVRYATSGTVVGGFTKLLKYAERDYQPDDFITFADHTISNGGLYENNGFVVDKVLPPDYMYVVKGERKHKFGYRLKRFRDDPELLWNENMSERELAQLNNIPRIWDAGKTRYRYTV